MPLNLLIVDDEEDVVEVLQDRLESYGFKVSSAATGMEAMDKLSKEKFDGVFLDLSMPEMGGLETLDRIRMNDENMVIIIITASSNRDAAVEAQAKGANDYLLKPFEWRELRGKMEKIYNLRL